MSTKTFYIDGKGYIDVNSNELKLFKSLYPNAIEKKPEAPINTITPKTVQAGKDTLAYEISPIAKTPEYKAYLTEQERLINANKVNDQANRLRQTAAKYQKNNKERYDFLMDQARKTDEYAETVRTGMGKWERAAFDVGKDLKESGVLGEISTYPLEAIIGLVDVVTGIPLAVTAKTKTSQTLSGLSSGLRGGIEDNEGLVKKLVYGTVYSLPMILPYLPKGSGAVLGTITTQGLITNQMLSEDIKNNTLTQKKMLADIVSGGIQAVIETGFTKSELKTIRNFYRAGQKEAAQAYISRIVKQSIKPETLKTIGSTGIQDMGEEVGQYISDIMVQNVVANKPLPSKKEFASNVATNALGGLFGGVAIGGVGSVVQIKMNKNMNTYLSKSNTDTTRNINDAIRLIGEEKYDAADELITNAEKNNPTNKYEVRAINIVKSALKIARAGKIIEEAYLPIEAEKISDELNSDPLSEINAVVKEASELMQSDPDSAQPVIERGKQLISQYKTERLDIPAQKRYEDVKPAETILKKLSNKPPVESTTTTPADVIETEAPTSEVVAEQPINTKKIGGQINEKTNTTKPSKEKKPKTEKVGKVSEAPVPKTGEWNYYSTEGIGSTRSKTETVSKVSAYIDELKLAKTNGYNGVKSLSNMDIGYPIDTEIANMEKLLKVTEEQIAEEKNARKSEKRNQAKPKKTTPKVVKQETGASDIRNNGGQENIQTTEKEITSLAEKERRDLEYKRDTLSSERTDVRKQIREEKDELVKNRLIQKEKKLDAEIIKANAILNDVKYRQVLDDLKSRGKSIKSVVKSFIKVLGNSVTNIEYNKDSAIISLENGKTLQINLVDGTVDGMAGKIQFKTNILAVIDIAKAYNRGNMTAYHEAGHFAFRYFLNEQQQKTLTNEFGNEEQAMENFAEYMKGKTFIGKITAIFKILKTKLLSLQNNVSPKYSQDTLNIFEQMATGEYRNDNIIQKQKIAKLKIKENSLANQNEQDVFKLTYNLERISNDNNNVGIGIRNMLLSRAHKILGELWDVRHNSQKPDTNADNVNYRTVLKSIKYFNGIESLKDATLKQLINFVTLYDPIIKDWLGDKYTLDMLIKLDDAKISLSDIGKIYSAMKSIMKYQKRSSQVGALNKIINSANSVIMTYGVKAGDRLVRLAIHGMEVEKKLQRINDIFISNEREFISRFTSQKTRDEIGRAIQMATEDRSDESLAKLYDTVKSISSERDAQDAIDIVKKRIAWYETYRAEGIKEKTTIKWLDKYTRHSLLIKAINETLELFGNVSKNIFAEASLERESDNSLYNSNVMEADVLWIDSRYANTMAKRIAYESLIAYFNKELVKDTPQALWLKHNKGVALSYIESIVKPERETDDLGKWLLRKKSQMYVFYLTTSLRAVAQNIWQRTNYRTYVNPDVSAWMRKNMSIWHGKLKFDMPKLNALAERILDMPPQSMLREEQAMIAREKKAAKDDLQKLKYGNYVDDVLSDWFFRNHPMFTAEYGNWMYGYMAGIIQDVMHGSGKKLFAEHLKNNNDVNASIEYALKDPVIMEHAYENGRITNSRINPDVSKVFGQQIFNSMLGRLLSFVRWSATSLERKGIVYFSGKSNMLNTVIENAQLLGDDYNIDLATNLQFLNLMLGNMKYISEHKRTRDKLDIDAEVFKQVKQTLTSQRDKTYKLLKETTPIKRWRMVINDAEYVVTSILIGALARYIMDLLQRAVTGKEQKEAWWYRYFIKEGDNALSVSSLFNPKTIMETYSPYNDRGDLDFAKAIEAVGMLQPLGYNIPYGVLSQITRRLTGKTIGKHIWDAVKP